MCYSLSFLSLLFLLDHTPTTEIYTLSLHDALPILSCEQRPEFLAGIWQAVEKREEIRWYLPEHVAVDGSFDHEILCISDRKSTRLNSSHLGISYAVFCLKKKKNKKQIIL